MIEIIDLTRSGILISTGFGISEKRKLLTKYSIFVVISLCLALMPTHRGFFISKKEIYPIKALSQRFCPFAPIGIIR